MADYEVIVVGSGVGGGAAASALADVGVSTLVVERGRPLADPAIGRDEHAMMIERAASDDRPLEISGRQTRALIGGLPGGGSALFGGALLRPSRDDFVPGRHYGRRIPRSIWEWPFDYDELEPYYDRAETLFRVAGDRTSTMPHLERRDAAWASQAPPLDPFNRRLAARLEAQGLHPFPLPLAIDFDACLRCGACPGYVCPTGARTSSDRTLLAPREKAGRVDLWVAREVRRIVPGPRAVRLELVDRASGRRHEVSAEHVLLAAGALGTPLLLEDSDLAGESGERGRNHMCHLGALAVSVFARSIDADVTFLKRLGLSDFYLGTPDLSEKMGSAQLVPVPGTAVMAEQLGVPLPRPLARSLHRRSILMAGYVEDLPRRENRVRRGPGGRIRLERGFDAFDVLRGRHLARALARAMRRAGAAVSVPHVASGDLDHLAHQVGTCRAGRDPKTSVVDADGRLHGQERLWIVDGSVLPTSLGVGPALTIAAHALRVADRVLGKARVTPVADQPGKEAA